MHELDDDNDAANEQCMCDGSRRLDGDRIGWGVALRAAANPERRRSLLKVGSQAVQSSPLTVIYITLEARTRLQCTPATLCVIDKPAE
jgi:hypothetical protein